MRLYTYLNEDSIPSFEKLIKSLSRSDWEFYAETKDIIEGFPELKGKKITTKLYYDFLVSKINSIQFPVKLYRRLDAHNSMKLALEIGEQKAKRPLGIFWSLLHMAPESSTGKKDSLLIEASVPKTSINWARTFMALMTLPYEKEITVIGPVKILKIFKHDKTILWENKANKGSWKTT